MSLNTFGHLFRVTTWGESHGPALGATVDGVPPEGQQEALRALPWTSLTEITERIKAAIEEQVNPVVAGKN